jgi:pimeloyl-ACP methyl ester carboxylesterase
MSIVLKREADGWTGTLDIPAQGLRNFALADVVVDGQTIRFILPGIPGDPRFEGTITGDTLAGEFNQGGATLPLSFKYGVELEEPRRPQEPKPPFPYESRDVTFDSLSEGVTLAGTITLPEGEGPFPAVVLVSGSGSQDRNEEIFGHKPFLVLSDRLTKAGIAVLRYDDRGAGQSTGDASAATSADLSMDAEAALRFLREQPKIDAGRVGIAGHSEGGLIAPMVAARSEDVAFIVLMAGPGVSGDQVLIRQVGEGAVAAGAAPEIGEAMSGAIAEMIELIESGAAADAVLPAIEKLLRVQMGLAPEAALPAGAAEAVYKQFAAPWFRYFLSYDPAEALSKVTVPVLVLQGSLDRQVNAQVNVAAIEKALEHNDQVQVEVLEGLNHLFQPAKTGAGSEYAQIETTMDERVPEIMAEWIKDMVERDEE